MTTEDKDAPFVYDCPCGQTHLRGYVCDYYFSRRWPDWHEYEQLRQYIPPKETPPVKATYDSIMTEAMAIANKKRADYASKEDMFSNFRFTNAFMKLFHPAIRDKYGPFLGLIGTKLARLNELLLAGRTPQNEPKIDSFIDLVNYIAMWGAYSEEDEDASKL